MKQTSNFRMKFQNAGQEKERQRPLTKKNKFTPDEDKRLKLLVGEYGTSEWGKIASLIPGRTSRQCRDRWSNYIDPKISMKPWTPLEDMQLIKRYMEIGPHWRIVANCFPGRSINNVRNRVVKLLKQTQEFCNDPSLLGIHSQQALVYPTQQIVMQSSPEEQNQQTAKSVNEQKEKSAELISYNSSPLASDSYQFSDCFFDIFGSQSAPEYDTSLVNDSSFRLLFE